MTIVQRRFTLRDRPFTIDVAVSAGFLNIIQVGEWLDLILHQLLENPEIAASALAIAVSETLSTYCYVESVKVRQVIEE
jgi:hypothetical protein